MPDPMPSLQEIQALRAQRASLDTQLYRTQLELQKLKSGAHARAPPVRLTHRSMASTRKAPPTCWVPSRRRTPSVRASKDRW